METMDYIKANRKGSRDAELERENGWTNVKKIHPTKKNYIRKPKHRNDVRQEW